MGVRFGPELQEKLARAAAEQGRESEALVVEAVERMLTYDECFSAKSKRVFPPPTAANLSSTTMFASSIDRRYPG